MVFEASQSVCLCGVYGGYEKGFRKSLTQERTEGEFKPAKQISVFVCGQQRHLKLFVSPSCLELILFFF